MYCILMGEFTKLELAALRSIFDETPELAPLLQTQLDHASVVERENSGGGFFTTMVVSGNPRPIEGPAHLGATTFANVTGLEHGMGFIVFLKHGRLEFLEGYAYAENTEQIDFTTVEFEFGNPLLD